MVYGSKPQERFKFRIKDVGFFKDGKILPKTSSLDLILTTYLKTMKISNQKNGYMGQIIHHESFELVFSPVKALT